MAPEADRQSEREGDIHYSGKCLVHPPQGCDFEAQGLAGTITTVDGAACQ